MPSSRSKSKAKALILDIGCGRGEWLELLKQSDLVDEVLRVLIPGGVAIFETPNPENLIVGACNFYADPTHHNPLPPESTRFVMEARGYGRIEMMRPASAVGVCYAETRRGAGAADRERFDVWGAGLCACGSQKLIYPSLPHSCIGNEKQILF